MHGLQRPRTACSSVLPCYGVRSTEQVLCTEYLLGIASLSSRLVLRITHSESSEWNPRMHWANTGKLMTYSVPLRPRFVMLRELFHCGLQHPLGDCSIRWFQSSRIYSTFKCVIPTPLYGVKADGMVSCSVVDTIDGARYSVPPPAAATSTRGGKTHSLVPEWSTAGQSSITFRLPKHD